MHITSESARIERRTRLRVPRPGDADQRRTGQRDADGLALATVDPVVAERTTRDALGCDTRETVRARRVVVCERRDHQVAVVHVPHLTARVLDNADELVPDRTDRVR